MNKTLAQGMTLRLELFVTDLPVSIDFYGRVLEFKQGESHSGGYTPMTKGKVNLGLNLLSTLPDDHPIQAGADERLGRGVEIVLEVADVAAVYERVLSQNWPLSAKLQPRPWGLSDFRLKDPDGYYLRITSRE